jgi:hypothetical protein
MTPSQTIIRAANKTLATTDKTGRRLVLRQLTALDTLRLFKAAGPILSQNEAWLSMAGLALSITEIDGIPVPQPTTEAQIENLVERLDEHGLAAIADVVNEPTETSNRKPDVGN